MSEEKTLNEMLKEIGYNDTPLRKEVINVFGIWLQQMRKEMFIPTVSLMDCELSGIREETFDELLEELNE